MVGRERVESPSPRTLSLILLAGALLTGAAARGDDAWRRSPVWDDGKAEYCVYEVSWSRYGHLYDGRASLITVKEPWAPDLEVKADRPRADGFDVLKLNHLRDVRTGVYDYHQMASLFVRRDDGALRKLAASSTEACGISTAQLVGGELTTRSYFDGQGERRQQYPVGALPEDGLPLLLRDLVTGPAPATLDVFPSLMAGRFPPLEPESMSVSRREGVVVEVPAGRFETVAVRVEGGEVGATYYFDAQSPYPLRKLERDDGTVYRQAKCERIAYWGMAGPGGENWLPESMK